MALFDTFIADAYGVISVEMGTPDPPPTVTVGIDRVFVVSTDVIKVIFNSTVAVTSSLIDISNYSITSLTGGATVDVEGVLPFSDTTKTTTSVFLRISRPSFDQSYQLTTVASALFTPDGNDVFSMTANWVHVPTKVDSVVNSLAEMYNARSRSNIRSIVEAISISDEEIGGSQRTLLKTPE
jgi:hypothetical protein